MNSERTTKELLITEVYDYETYESVHEISSPQLTEACEDGMTPLKDEDDILEIKCDCDCECHEAESHEDDDYDCDCECCDHGTGVEEE